MRTYTFRGEAARRRREELGLRASDVAAAAGIATGTLWNCEAGTYQPSAPVYIRICEALQVKPDELREPVATTRRPAEGSAA